jgi:hypothetical protein
VNESLLSQNEKYMSHTEMKHLKAKYFVHKQKDSSKRCKGGDGKEQLKGLAGN